MKFLGYDKNGEIELKDELDDWMFSVFVMEEYHLKYEKHTLKWMRKFILSKNKIVSTIAYRFWYYFLGGKKETAKEFYFLKGAWGAWKVITETMNPDFDYNKKENNKTPILNYINSDSNKKLVKKYGTKAESDKRKKK